MSLRCNDLYVKLTS